MKMFNCSQLKGVYLHNWMDTKGRIFLNLSRTAEFLATHEEEGRTLSDGLHIYENQLYLISNIYPQAFHRSSCPVILDSHISTYKRSQYKIVLASNFDDQKHLEDYLFFFLFFLFFFERVSTYGVHS